MVAGLAPAGGAGGAAAWAQWGPPRSAAEGGGWLVEQAEGWGPAPPPESRSGRRDESWEEHGPRDRALWWRGQVAGAGCAENNRSVRASAWPREGAAALACATWVEAALTSYSQVAAVPVGKRRVGWQGVSLPPPWPGGQANIELQCSWLQTERLVANRRADSA